jgi:PAS domain S-box-containing protein
VLRGIRIRLLGLVLLAVVPTFGLLLYAARVERDRMLQDEREQVRALASAVAQQHQRWVEGVHGLLIGLAQMRSVRALDASGCGQSLAPLLASATIYANVGAARLDGQVFCSGVPEWRPVNVADRPFFDVAVRTGRFAAGAYVMSRMLGVPALGFGHPVRGLDDSKVAVVFASLSVKEMQRQLESVPFPAGATVVVVDRRGVVLGARPDPQAWTGTPFEPRLLAELRDGAAPRTVDGPDGVSRIYAAESVLTPVGEVAMRVVVGLPAAGRFGPVDLVVGRTLLAFGGVALLALLVAAAVGDRLFVHKLRALMTAAGRLARGDYTARSGLRPGSEELGEFIRSFDRMAESLEQLSRQNRLLLESVGEGIVGTDQHGWIVFANPAAAHLLGWSVEELLGREAHQLFHPRAPDGSPAPLDQCRLHGAGADAVRPDPGEEHLWRRDGTFFPAECVSTPVRDGEALVGAVLAFRDVSERKRLEEQLRQSQKMEAIGQLAGGVAHDFNNVLTAILSCGRFLQDELPDGHPGRADADQIVTSAQRAAALTRQLLTVSRRQRLAPRVFGLGGAVRGMEQMLQRLMGEGIRLEVEVRAAGTVEADPAQLELVILNLAVNARDAMPDGGRLAITVDEVADAAAAHPGDGTPPVRRVVLCVRDTGEGMTLENQARMFEPFFTTKAPGKGTGLGLSMVYGVVTQSGGSIDVRSRPGQGTEIRVYLPCRSEQARGAPPPARDVSGGTESILLVEDEAVVRALARRALVAAGYQVLEAASPSEAISAAADPGLRIDLLLTDVLLPDRNGWELSRQIAAARPGLRVLFMSGYAGRRLDGAAILPPDAPLVAKPFKPEELSRAVRRVLDADRTIAAHGAVTANA